MYKANQILLAMVLVLVACAEQPTKSTILVPVEERTVPVESNQPVTAKSEVSPGKESRGVDKQKVTVIVALLDDAIDCARKGQSEKAAATIEGTLSI